MIRIFLGFSLVSICIMAYENRSSCPFLGNGLEFTCLGTRTAWVGDLNVICEAVSCRRPPEVPNANVSTSNGLEYQSDAIYTCATGYTLTTLHRVRTCTETGQWSLEQINCEREITCGQVPEVLHATATPIGKTEFKTGESSVYVCQPSFVLSTSANRITCREHGWERSSVQCLSVPCGDPPLIENSTREITLDVSSLFYSVRYTCDLGYMLQNRAVSEMSCVGVTSRVWTNEPVRCVPDGCGPPPEVANANVTFTSTSTGAEAVYSCNGGFRLTPTSTNRR